MTPILEKTCKCIKECIFDGYEFHKGREYQVDIYPLFNKIIIMAGGMTTYSLKIIMKINLTNISS